LGAPKQEELISLLQPKLHSTICVGVGLVFEYFAGTVARAPIWAQKSGLEWLYRLLQQPAKFKRIIKPFTWISVKLVQSLFLNK
jgi:N-acetylglucosaminyldiphosphoundecaprenol N-acetyl-beta-D-mannosaminyltransferase